MHHYRIRVHGLVYMNIIRIIAHQIDVDPLWLLKYDGSLLDVDTCVEVGQNSSFEFLQGNTPEVNFDYCDLPIASRSPSDSFE